MSGADNPTTRGAERLHALGAEARRLMEFKKQHVRRNHLTPCSQCATPVSIQASKCPHCTSDIAPHTRHVREELQRLKEITAELYEIHKKELELLRQEASETPLRERVRIFCTDPRLLQDMKIVLPFLIGVFTVVFFLKGNSSGLVFLLGTLGCGFVAYSLFQKWGLNRFVTLDLYRAVLVFGLVVVLSGASFDSAAFWPDFSFVTGASASPRGSVVVQSVSANIRRAPSAESEIVTTARNGEKLKVLEKRDSWYRVRTGSGQAGWVYAPLVGASGS
jgi:hypothetical protein